MKAIVVTCPHCGARVQVKGSSPEVKCDYCETVARVQRRTQFFERTLPPPKGGPKLVAVQKHGKWFAIIMASTFLLPLGIVGFVFWQINRTTDRVMSVVKNPGAITTPAVSSRPPSTEWQGNRPLLMDVDGDGKPEILGRARVLHPLDEIRIVAIDGSTGKPRWQGPSLGTYNDTYQGFISVAGGLVLFASPRGEVHAFEPRDGTPKWTAKLDEKIEHFCDAGGGALVAYGKDKVERALDRATGAVSHAPAEKPSPAPVMRRPSVPAGCPALPDDNHASWRGRHDGTRDYATAKRLGMNAQRTEPLAGGARLYIGQRESGTRTPLLAVVEASGAERWKVVVATDPLGAGEQSPEHVAVGDREVCAVYAAKSGTFDKRLSCFGLVDGARRWDLPVPDETDHMLVHNRAIVLAADDGLQLHDLDSGAQRWRWPAR